MYEPVGTFTGTEAAPETSVIVPNEVEFTLNATVPVGTGEDEDVTLTANVIVVPGGTEVPGAGEVILNVGAGRVPVPLS